MTDRELRPVGYYEWVQIIRRARLGAVIASSGRIGANGRSTRGGMSGTTFTGIALCWASYGNDRGQQIRPGDATVAVDMETTIAAASAVRKALLDIGLLQLVRPRRGRLGAEYRLTMPEDLYDRLEVPSPAQHGLAAGRLRDGSRGRRKTAADADGPTLLDDADDLTDDTTDADDTPTVGGPVEYPKPVEPPTVGTPPDPPKPGSDVASGGSGGVPEKALGGSGGTSWGGPVARSTVHDRTTTTTGQPQTDLRTAATLVGDPPPEQDQILESRGATPPPADGPCATHPALPGGTRGDGQPRCAACRAAVVPRRGPDPGLCEHGFAKGGRLDPRAVGCLHCRPNATSSPPHLRLVQPA